MCIRDRVQPAHDAGIDAVGDPQRVQILAQGGKVGAAVLAQVVQHLRRVGELVRVLLAVEDAQGVALEALVAGLAQGVKLAGEVLLQRRLIGPCLLYTS